MHCLEYCFCLITTIIITIMIIIIIIIVIINIVITIWSIIIYKYYLEYNCGNKIVSILNFRKLFTNLTQKVMSTPKTEMKSKYETRSSCTPVNKTGIKNVFCGYSGYTTICYLNQQSHRENFK